MQQHLLNIKESVETVVASLSDFLDAASRIAVDPASRKADGMILFIVTPFNLLSIFIRNIRLKITSSDLKRLLTPLRNSYALVAQLKQNIDHLGWTLAALARPRNRRGGSAGNDALDQFVAVVKQVFNIP